MIDKPGQPSRPRSALVPTGDRDNRRSIIRGLVGADQEHEARRLIRRFIALADADGDWVLAIILRRCLLENQPLATVAAEADVSVVEVTARLLGWADAVKVALELHGADPMDASDSVPP